MLVAAVFKEQGRDEARALLHGRSLHAPYLLDYEIANVSLKKLTRDRIGREAVAAALRAYGQLAIERHGVDAESMLSIAERYQITAYDAAYLCIAERLGAPLATLDSELAEAARAHLTSERQVHEAK